MLRLVKILAWLVAVAAVAVVVLVTVVSLLIDPNDYKEDIAAVVRDRTGRDIDIAGDLELSVFPWLGVETGAVALANAEGFGDEPMLSIEGASVRLRLLPLLGRQVEADTVIVRGLRLVLIRESDGRDNWSDLAGAEAAPAPGDAPATKAALGALAIQGVDVRDGFIRWDDRAAGQRYEIDRLDLKTGAIVPGQPIPVTMDLRVTGTDIEALELHAETQASIALAERTLALTGLELKVAGDINAALTLDAVEMHHETRALSARGLAVGADHGDISVRLTLPELSADLAAQRLAGRGVSAELTGAGIEMALELSDIDAALADGTVTAGALTGRGRVGDVDIDVALPGAQADLAAATMLARELDITARRGELSSRATVPTIEVDLKSQTLSVPAFAVDAPASRLSGSVRADGLLDAPRFSGRLEASSDSLRTLLAALDVQVDTADADVLGKAGLAADFEASAASAALSAMRVSLDDITLEGRLDVSRFDPLAVRAELAFGPVVLDPYLPPAGQDTPPSQGDAALAATAPLGLGALDIAAQLRIARLELRQAGYAVDELLIDVGTKNDAGAYPAEVAGRVSGAALPEPIALAARTMIALSDRQASLSEVTLAARGETLAAELSTPSLSVDLAAGGAAVEALSASLQHGGVQAELSLARLELAADARTLSAAELAGRVAVEGYEARLAAPGVSGDLERNAYTLADVAVGLEHGQPVGELRAASIAVDLSAQSLDAPALVFTSEAGRVEAALQGTRIVDAPAIEGTLKSEDFNLRRLLSDLGAAPQTVDPQALTRARLDVAFRVGADAVSVKPLIAAVDDTELTGFLEMDNPAQPRYRFELDVNGVDMDRYASTAAGAESEANAAAAIVLPVAMMRDLDADGELRIGRFKSAGLVVTDVDVVMRSNDGLIELDPIRANLYEGRSEGSIVVDARSAAPTIRIVETLSALQLGPALADAGVTDRLTGVGGMALELSASGIDGESLRRSLRGRVGFDFRDGAIKGLDIRRVVVEARALYARARGREVTVETLPEDETRFSEMTGTLQIAEGVARNDDLDIKSPLLRIKGKGAASLVEDRVDYLLDVTVVESLKGQGGESLDDLKGVTIPIRVRGPLAQPSYQVDIGKLLEARARQELEEEKRKAVKKLEEKLQEKLGDQLQKLFK